MTSTTSFKSKNNDKLCDTKVRLLCEEAEQEINHLYDIFDILVPKKIETNEAQTTKSINNNNTSNMSSKIAPPPPPQTAEFGWGSQQEANKTKKDKKEKNDKNEYHFDDLVKNNILSFINQPPLVKIVSNEWWKKNRCDVLYREIEVNGRHSSVVTTQYRDVTRHTDTKVTKKALGIKGAGKLKVFVDYGDSDDFDERAQTQIVYKYDVCALPSHPLGKDTEWGFMARCPQGKAYVVFN